MPVTVGPGGQLENSGFKLQVANLKLNLNLRLAARRASRA
jgi:hypothetical protein